MNIDKYELGLEIISGIKAFNYDMSINDSREMVLEGTEPAENAGQDEIDFCKAEKEILYKQAIYITEITLAKIKELEDTNGGK